MDPDLLDELNAFLGISPPPSDTPSKPDDLFGELDAFLSSTPETPVPDDDQDEPGFIRRGLRAAGDVAGDVLGSLLPRQRPEITGPLMTPEQMARAEASMGPATAGQPGLPQPATTTTEPTGLLIPKPEPTLRPPIRGELSTDEAVELARQTRAARGQDPEGGTGIAGNRQVPERSLMVQQDATKDPMQAELDAFLQEGRDLESAREQLAEQPRPTMSEGTPTPEVVEDYFKDLARLGRQVERERNDQSLAAGVDTGIVDLLLPRNYRRAFEAGLSDAFGVIGSGGRAALGNEDTPYQTLVEQGYIEQTPGEVGAQVAGAFSPIMAEIYATRGLAGLALLSKAAQGGRSGQLLRLVAQGGAGSRGSGVVAGVLEGTPSEVANLIETQDLGTAGAGSLLGGVMGGLVPGGRVSGHFAKGLRQDPTQIRADMLELIEAAEDPITARTFASEQLIRARANAAEAGDAQVAQELDRLISDIRPEEPSVRPQEPAGAPRAQPEAPEPQAPPVRPTEAPPASADDLRTLDPEDPNSERFRQLYNERNAPAPASRPRANDPEVEARPQTPEVAATPAVRVPDDVRPARENINEVVDASFMSGRVVGDEVARVDDLRGGIGSAANDHRRVEALVDEITGPDGYWERIIVDQDDNVVEGAHRLEAARLLGFDEVPVTRIADNTASIDETVAHAALKGRGLRSDQRNQLVGNVGEMVADAGSVRAAREAYDLPRGFEDHYNTVLDALEGTSARPAEAPVTPRLPDDVPPVRPVRASDVANDPDGAYVYHVTSEPNARSIMTDGFRQGQPTAGRGGSYPANSAGRTFFTDKQGVSEWVRRIEAHLFDQFDDPPPISVLRVRRDALESMSSLKDDPIQDVVGSRSMMANTDELEDLLDFDARFDLLEAPVTPRTPDPDPAPAPRTPRAAEGPAARLEETPDPPRTAREPVRPADLDKPEVRQRFDDAIHKPRTNDSVLGDLSEAGFIDPALLRTLAPSAAFGTAGAVVGSTLGARSAQKEEDVTERAVLGAALGAVVGLGPAGWRVLDHLRDDKGVGKTFRKYLTAGGPLPSAVKEMTTAKEMSRELLDATRDALSRRRGSGSLFDQITAQKVGDFADAVGRTYGGTGRARVRIGGDNPMDFVPEADKEAIRRLLTGDATARGELSEQVADAVDAWRHHIDANSVTLKKIGAAEGDLAATLDKHMGIYLNRSYRVFDVPDWEKNAPKLLGDAEWERRKNQFKSWYRDSMDEFDEDTVEAIMEDLIAAGPHGNPLRFIEDNSARLNKNIFKRRNDKLPLAIRELWGEYDDPFLQYTRTVAKQSQYIANFKFLGEMREVGEGSLFWFPRNAAGEVIDDAIKAQDKKIVNSGERVGKGMTAKLEKNMGPLAGARTTPEMAAAIKEHFEGVRQIDNGLGKALVWTLSWVKIAKTAFSQVTQIRNLTGNPMMLMEQGHFDFKLPLRVLRGSRTLLEGSGTVRSSGDAKLYYNELLRRNIINDTANATEIEEALKRVNGVPLSSWGSKNPLARQARRLVRAGKEIPLSLYRAGDDLFKIAMYELEQTRYLKALGHSDATKAPRELVEKMKDRSARATRNLMPTYSQTPEVINKIRRWGGFLSWPAERMRNIYYTFRQMEDDWKYGDGEFKGIAMQRAFGLAASLSMQGAGLTIASRKIFNITKEEENAVREFVLPWDENANLVFLDEIGEDGNFEVWNSTYTAPSSQFIRPVVAFMRGEDWRPTLAEVTQEIIAPYAQLNPALTEAVERLRASGDDEAFEFTMRMLDGMVESVTPGAIEQWTRANTGFSSSLYPLDRKKEYMALRTGQKSFTSKIEDDLLWDFRGLRGRLDSVTEKFDRAERAGRVNRFGTRSLEGLEENTTQRRRDVYMDVARKAHAALVLGKSEREIRALMQEADMSTENRELVWRLINQQRVRWER